MKELTTTTFEAITHSIFNMKHLYLFSGLIFFMACSGPVQENQAKESNEVKAPNIILMIGDGMGISQISSAMIKNNWNLNLEKCDDIGFIKTYSANNMITESAAGATAFACGEKTYNGAIGVSKDTLALKNMVEALKPNGYQCGLISTSSIVHATPAAFYAHVDHRKKYEEIALQLMESDIDAFSGGGYVFFENREDERNLISEFSEKGFVRVNDPKDLSQHSDKRVGYLGAEDGMPRMLDGRGDFLSVSTKAMLDRFSQNESPFFLMIEGSQIDWGGHANDGKYIETEMMDFDQVIGTVIDFIEENENTLLVITADHETGGFSITGGESDSLEYKFTSGDHTPVIIPVMSYGRGSEYFKGFYENNEIFNKILEASGNLPN